MLGAAGEGASVQGERNYSGRKPPCDSSTSCGSGENALARTHSSSSAAGAGLCSQETGRERVGRQALGGDCLAEDMRPQRETSSCSRGTPAHVFSHVAPHLFPPIVPAIVLGKLGSPVAQSNGSVDFLILLRRVPRER